MKSKNEFDFSLTFSYACIAWAIFVLMVVLIQLSTPIPEIEIKNDYQEMETVTEVQIEPVFFKSKPEPYFSISETDRYIIECVVAGEAKGESFKGMKLVAQCILNAMSLNSWDAETVRIEYQYGGWDSELENTNPEIWKQIELAVSEVFDFGIFETEEPILYFYAPKYSSGSWHENNLIYVLTEGGHKFFKLP